MGTNKVPLAASWLAPLDEPVQRAERVYSALLDTILRGDLVSGEKINADGIAQRLKVSTTPVRDALGRLEKDGLVVKLPYQGWFVRDFPEQEIRDIYEMRAGMECIGVRLACERIAPQQIEWLRAHQAAAEAGPVREDMEAYRIYNRELHGAIVRAARNVELAAGVSHIVRKTLVLSARAIRVPGRAPRAVEEHGQLIERIAARDSAGAQQVMERHILGALDSIVRQGLP